MNCYIYIGSTGILHFVWFLSEEGGRFTRHGQGTLKVNNVQEEDEGSYTCRATNQEDSVDTEATITVQGKIKHLPTFVKCMVNIIVARLCYAQLCKHNIRAQVWFMIKPILALKSLCHTKKWGKFMHLHELNGTLCVCRMQLIHVSVLCSYF